MKREILLQYLLPVYCIEAHSLLSHMNRSLVARALEPVGKFGNHDIGLARGGRSVVLFSIID